MRRVQPAFQTFDPQDWSINVAELIKGKVYPGSPYRIKLKEYEILSELGSGSFGTVYLCRDTINKIYVAVKLINIQSTLRSVQTESKSKIVEIFNRESELMKVCKNPNIIKCYRTFQNPRCKMFVLEYCSGKNLLEYLEECDWSISEEEAIGVLKQICLGVGELHRNKIIHRDLKLQNIMKSYQIYKIIDFGLGKHVKTESEIIGNTICGTSGFMAPEMKNKKPYGFKVDIFSIGIIYMKLICANRPYSERRMSLISNKQVILTKEGYPISDQSMDFLRKTLAKHPAQRINWKEILDHPIFSKHSYLSTSYLQQIEQRIVLFRESTIQIQLNDEDLIDQSVILMKKSTNTKSQILVISQKINEALLEVKKSEFILKEIVKNFEKPEYGLIDKQNGSQMKMLYSLTKRAFICLNYSIACLQNEKCLDFVPGIRQLQGLSIQQYKKYTDYLESFRTGVGQTIKSSISKFFCHFGNSKKEELLTQFQHDQGEKRQQITMIFNYIIKILPQIEIGQLKRRMMAFKQVMMLKPADLKESSADAIITDIIQNRTEYETRPIDLNF